jgi:fermentation-respiration switch protein FrsA (DUF1100 family)
VLNGGGGGIDEYRGAILASHGYAALSLGYFGMDGLPRGLVNIPLEYFGNAIGWMRAQPLLGDRFLAVWGESRGGELALLLGATFTEINAVIAERSSVLGAWPRRTWRHETARCLDVPGKTAAVSPGEQCQHGNAATRGGWTCSGFRAVLPRPAPQNQRCGALDDPGRENARPYSACVGNR